jgi:hypothetical protein
MTGGTNLVVHDDRMELGEGGEAEEDVDNICSQIWINFKMFNLILQILLVF